MARRENLIPALALNDAAAKSDETADRLVAELRRIWSRSAVSTLVRVGELIISECYEGDIVQWRNRGTNARLRRLERHESLPFSRKTIYFALHFHDLSLRVAGKPFLNQLGVGHLRAVLGLPASEQEQLLVATHDHDWTIAELTKRVAHARRLSGRKTTGRPPAPLGLRAVRRIRQHVVALEQLLVDETLIEKCSPERLTHVLSALAEIRAEVASWEQKPEPAACSKPGQP